VVGGLRMRVCVCCGLHVDYSVGRANLKFNFSFNKYPMSTAIIFSNQLLILSITINESNSGR
jgi:hypothetical protein